MATGSGKTNNAAEIDRLALALAKEPGSKAFIPLAEEYGKAGMWQEAAGVLEDGLKTYPNFITAMVALGRAYDQLNQPVKAKAILEEAVKLSPENLRAHRTLAKIYGAQGLKEACLRSCDVILSVNPQDQEALALRAALGTPDTAHQARDREPAVQPESVAAASALPSNAILEEERTALRSIRSDGAGMPQSAPTAVARLERWLAAIHTRRRDDEQPHATPTS